MPPRAVNTSAQQARQILHTSQHEDWCTPLEIIEPIRSFFGGTIALDPASSADANNVVRARHFFTQAHDGLSRSWRAKTLFLNPPYGKTGNASNAGIWSRKLIDEFQSGRTMEAILLVNAATDRRWFHPLWHYWICFLYQRVKFWRPRENHTGPTHASVLVYFGSRPKSFKQFFQPLGKVVLPENAVVQADEPSEKDANKKSVLCSPPTKEPVKPQELIVQADEIGAKDAEDKSIPRNGTKKKASKKNTTKKAVNPKSERTRPIKTTGSRNRSPRSKAKRKPGSDWQF